MINSKDIIHLKTIIKRNIKLPVKDKRNLLLYNMSLCGTSKDDKDELCLR